MNLPKRFLYASALPALLVTIWWATSSTSTNFFLPKPVPLVSTFAETWVGERIFSDVLPSIGRLLGGVAMAILLGVLGGLLIGSVRWLRELTEPILEFFRAIPPPVLVPVLILLLGVNDSMKITVIVSGCIWPVLLNTIEGVRAIDSVLTDSARTYGITGRARVRYLVLPSAGPQIMAGVRQCLSLGLILMVISEMFASSSGLGFTIVQFQRSFAVPEMWSGIVLLGLIGVVMSFIFQWAERRVLRWYHGLREVENAA
jgi:ABC-type nitrate/sulfonate/bicarbonate transport system permease component